MNYWLQLSLDYAKQKSYLDDLFLVYPTIPEGIREINQTAWQKVEKSFLEKDNLELLKNLLKLDLFPIKDSYVAYLKRDKAAIERNPQTVNRICGRIYELGLENIFARCNEPKETNRQIGPFFRRWLNKGSLGIQPLKMKDFLANNENAILDAGDAEMMRFAKEHLNYSHNKGLDMVARFNGKYVIAEAKFLTDFGGHQNAQFNDVISTVEKPNLKIEKVLMLDGDLSYDKMYEKYSESYKDYNIMSILVLREFLYQI
jgi:Tsp45I type II restriction enzyme